MVFHLAIAKFHIVASEEIDVQLFNSKRAPITFDELPLIINQYKNDSNFFVEIDVDGPGVYVDKSEVIIFHISLILVSCINKFHFLKIESRKFLTK